MENEEQLQKMIELAVAKAIAPFIQPRRKVLLTRDAVCQRLGKDKSTLYRWAKSGYLPVAAWIGGKCFYDEEDVMRIEAGEMQI